jgi:hypothetical protein
MFELDPKARPTVRACFRKFKTGLGRDVFRSPGDMLIEPRLAEWYVSHVDAKVAMSYADRCM